MHMANFHSQLHLTVTSLVMNLVYCMGPELLAEVTEKITTIGMWLLLIAPTYKTDRQFLLVKRMVNISFEFETPFLSSNLYRLKLTNLRFWRKWIYIEKDIFIINLKYMNSFAIVLITWDLLRFLKCLFSLSTVPNYSLSHKWELSSSCNKSKGYDLT